MMALLRLAILSFFFGGALALVFRILRLPLRIVSPGGRGECRLPSPLRFLLDFFSAVFVGISFCVFLFWQADGIPRLFVFVAAALGVFFVVRPLSPVLNAVEGWLTLLVRRVAGPPLRLFLRLLSGALSVLRKIAVVFIKRVKKQHTKLVSCVYRRREPRRTAGRRMRSRIARAIGGREV